MSMLKRILTDIFHLFFPPVCPVCDGDMTEGEHFICTSCRMRAPLTGLCDEADNPMVRRLDGLLPVERASAMIWFIDGSGWQQMIHSFKYGGKWRYARLAGEWYGAQLRRSGLYDDIDVIVPVPLHYRKRLRRGYNQSEYLADGIASALGVKVERRCVVRCKNNPSQTSNTAAERWRNVEGIFHVRNAGPLRGKHILLVDDVFTTGATIVSCGEEILRSVEGARLSVATLAVTQRSMALDR